MTTKHTPGPWVARQSAHGPIDIFDSQERDVVTVYGGGVPSEHKQANARLIAAAPELLDALKAMDAAICEGFETQAGRMAGRKALIAARAAIAKAEGRND
jgi:hypothetical protein